jgi:DNA replication protein DnaC
MERLKALRLDTMAAAWMEQTKMADIGRADFDERFGLLVDAEWVDRENRRLTRLLREAKLRYPHACIEDIDYPAKRELDKATTRQIATGRWILDHLNVCITGATGTGKSYLGCAFAQLACRKGYRALYRRAPRLYEELRLAYADGSYTKVLARIAKIDVLVIDDWGLSAVGDRERDQLLEILEDRSESRSTIVTSQLPISKWHEQIGDSMIADGICDRLLSSAYKIALKGPSRRPDKAKRQESQEQE